MSIELAQQLELQAKHLREAAAAPPQIPMFKSMPSLTSMPTIPQASTPDQLQALIQHEVQRQLASRPAMPPSTPAPQQPSQSDLFGLAMYQLMKESLKPQEIAWVDKHIKEGYPGFMEFLKSDSIKAVMQMGFEAYKDFLEGKAK